MNVDWTHLLGTLTSVARRPDGRERNEQGALQPRLRGLVGDHDLHHAQNKTFAESGTNGVTVFIFENLEPNKYIFKGLLRLAGAPYAERQLDI